MASFRSLFALGALSLGLLAAGCSDAGSEDNPASEDDDYTRRGKLQLLVTVDWEGRDLREENLRAMQNLHAHFPQVKIVHFLNAAYFTKSDIDATYAKTRIASAIADGDEKGLHIHGWKRLFEASGVTFKSSPTFWGTSLRPNECINDCGHEVPISLYSTSELRKVVKFSLDKLESQGFGRAKSFRCGGWMAKPEVREAIAAEGLLYEESAVPVVFLQPKLATVPVYGWLSDLWHDTTQTSQPYKIPTAAGELTEIPDNGALADYVSADQMYGTWEANKAVFLAGNKKKNVVVSIGFHHETAATYLPQLEAALTRIYANAKDEKLPLESVTTAEVVAGQR